MWPCTQTRLLIVTADHETGGLRLPPALSEETIDKVCYDTTGLPATRCLYMLSGIRLKG